jgi:hypothetical protein
LNRCVLLFVCLLFCVNVSAITIDNPRVFFKGVKDRRYSFDVTIKNPEENPAGVRAYLADFEYIEPFNGPKRFLPPGSLDNSIFKWVSIYPDSFVIPPLGEYQVKVTVVPAEEVDEVHCGVVFFETALAGAGGGGEAVNVLGRIGSLIYVQPTKESVSGNFGQCSADGKRILNELTNTGNSFVQTDGSFYILDERSKVMSRGVVEEKYLMPGSKAELVTELADDVPPGEYFMVLTIELGEKSQAIREVDFKLAEDGSVEILETR